MTHLATHHKGNCSRLRNCLSQAPSQQPPGHFCLVIKMHQRIFASPETNVTSSHKLTHTSFCLLTSYLFFFHPRLSCCPDFIQVFKCLSFGETLILWEWWDTLTSHRVQVGSLTGQGLLLPAEQQLRPLRETFLNCLRQEPASRSQKCLPPVVDQVSLQVPGS